MKYESCQVINQSKGHPTGAQRIAIYTSSDLDISHPALVLASPWAYIICPWFITLRTLPIPGNTYCPDFDFDLQYRLGIVSFITKSAQLSILFYISNMTVSTKDSSEQIARISIESIRNILRSYNPEEKILKYMQYR